jgi:hypothetical protein
MNMKKKLEFATGEWLAPENEKNDKSVFNFFSEFLSIKDSDKNSLLKFLKRWGISPLSFERATNNIEKDIQSELERLRSVYKELLEKILTKRLVDITKDEFASINNKLAKVNLMISSPTFEEPIQRINYVRCFYTNDQLDMEVSIVRKGHPHVDPQEARIVCILKPKSVMPFTYKETPVDRKLFKYLAKNTESSLLDEYQDKWVVEKQNFILKKTLFESYNEITLYIGGINKRKSRNKPEEIQAAFNYDCTLENVLIFKIWFYFYMSKSQRSKKLCIVCYNPVNRPNSNHCGTKECIDRIKSEYNSSRYKSHK